MNHEIVNEYLKEVKKELSGLCSADEFLSSMREYLDDYCDEHPDCTIRDLKDEFRTPEEVAGEFLESKGISNSGKVKKLKNSRRLIAIIAVVLVVVLIAVIAFYRDVFNQSTQAKATDVIVVEPPEVTEDPVLE